MNFPVSLRYNDTSFNISFVQCWQNENVKDVLENIFAEWNNGSGQEGHLFLQSACRSLSVGDYVKVGDQWYRCASFGWDEVSKESVDLWFAEMEACRQARLPGKTYHDERVLRLHDRRKVEDKLGIFS